MALLYSTVGKQAETLEQLGPAGRYFGSRNYPNCLDLVDYCLVVP